MMRDRNIALRKASKSKSEQDMKSARSIRNLVNQYIKRARSDYLQEQINFKRQTKKVLEYLERHN